MIKRLRASHFNFLPNMVTLFNLFTGFVSLIMAANGHFRTACALALLSLLWDSLDGNIARIFKNTSQLGKELDSLADLVSFVVAPAFILACLFYVSLNNSILLVLFAYLGAGAFRLAIFNLSNSPSSSKDFFTGLPTPAAAVILNMVLLASFKNHWTGTHFFELGICLLAVLLSFLMVSKVRYPKLSAMKFSKWKSLLYFGLAFSGLVWLLVNFETALAAMPLFFLFVAPVYCLPVFGEELDSQKNF